MSASAGFITRFLHVFVILPSSYPLTPTTHSDWVTKLSPSSA
jgi:hypothetical protein